MRSFCAAFFFERGRRLFRDVERGQLVRLGGELQREPARIAEAVEHASADILGGRLSILPLIEKGASLLAVVRINVIANPALSNGDDVGDGAMKRRHRLIKALEEPYARIISREHTQRIDELHQHVDQFRQQPIGCLRQGLHDEIVVVAIDDERGNQIAFGMHQPIRRRLDRQALAERQRLRKTGPPKRSVDLHVMPRHQPQRDLRLIAEKRTAEKAAALIHHPDDVACGGSRTDNVGAINPQVAVLNPVFAAAGNGNGGMHVDFGLWSLGLGPAFSQKPKA